MTGWEKATDNFGLECVNSRSAASVQGFSWALIVFIDKSARPFSCIYHFLDRFYKHFPLCILLPTHSLHSITNSSSWLPGWRGGRKKVKLTHNLLAQNTQLPNNKKKAKCSRLLIKLLRWLSMLINDRRPSPVKRHCYQLDALHSAHQNLWFMPEITKLLI